MKKLLLVGLALVAISASAGDRIFGHVVFGEEEIEIYKTQDGCADPTWLRASRYPKGRRADYTMGCWQPIDKETFRVQFDDGISTVFTRKQILLDDQFPGPKISL